MRLDAPEASTWLEMDDVSGVMQDLPGVERSLVEAAG